MKAFISVSELNEYISNLLAADEFLSDFWIKGEISGFKYYRQSGHMYFNLKDEQAAVSCVMFRNRNQGLKFELEDGLEVLARVYVSVYPRQGKYQVYVQDIQPYGKGGLYLKLEQLRKKLEAAGYFLSDKKKAIPPWVDCVGIVTSQDGAALKDILRVIRQRHPGCEVILVHSSVQGENAPMELAEGIRLINTYGRAQVIIIGRGGGSLEDLMAFNTETVVKAIFESAIPVISAVGHEIDFSLADLAADLRAATPTQAASLAVPDIPQLNNELMKYTQRMNRLMEQKLGQYSETLDRIMLGRVWKEPDIIIKEKKRQVSEEQERINRQVGDYLQLRCHRYSMAVEALDNLSPLKVLQRGYAVAYKNHRLMAQMSQAEIGDYLELIFKDGKLGVRVGSKEMVADEKK
ncbi:MAG: exodeoxyribonuclease VII large subunit [Syntrophomonadaceae bacterium]|jgi:exodeoxyribonuclease VII large subunit|nr:exodeoxyribonuclease VII large subunit [Syntrophomonadaceae bacterium]